jgi:poly-beta-1,6-N-acetyl-D-glucosamine synthase
MTDSHAYVLVTPARNEEATIEQTILSVVGQTIPPAEWVIVSDGSTDRTDAIVRDYAARYKFIRLLRLEKRPARNFSSVVFATESGLNHLQTTTYNYVGLFDSDVRFQKDYFEILLQRFAENPKLGLAAGPVLDVVDGKHIRPKTSSQDVAGAAQFFRRECFEALGGLIAIPEGGWDAITNVQARGNGYQTRIFADLVVDHLKPRNISEGGMFRRRWQLGVRDYALGYHPLYEAGKCLQRWQEPPMLISSFARMTGFAHALLTRRPRALPPAVIAQVRREQKERMFGRKKTS